MIVSYIEINKEHDTVGVTAHTHAMVDNACKQCTTLCVLVDAFHAYVYVMERISVRLNPIHRCAE